MSMTYSDYLKVEELLNLQKPRSDGPEHDEMLFILIHQVYELWFKQILHEVDYLKTSLVRNQASEVLATFKRVLTILKTLVAQVDVLETMTPTSFLSFRARLESASGFQSAQFRELEFALGRKNKAVIDYHAKASPARQRLEKRFAEDTVYDAFLQFLKKNGVVVSEALLKRDVSLPLEPSVELQKALVDIYRNKRELVPVCERLLDLDEGLQEWRYRHVKMVERTIGFKKGTGGSPGVPYLWNTIAKPIYEDLWAIRSEL